MAVISSHSMFLRLTFLHQRSDFVTSAGYCIVLMHGTDALIQVGAIATAAGVGGGFCSSLLEKVRSNCKLEIVHKSRNDGLTRWA